MEETPGYFHYWGKADLKCDGEPKWHPLVYHCLDVAACGQILLSRQPAWLENLARLSGIEQAAQFSWAVFLLAIHDIGKFGEGFQSLRHDLQQDLQGRVARVAYDARHDTLGYALAIEHLREWFGRDPQDMLEDDLLHPWLAAVTGHHGRPPRNLPTRPLVGRQFPPAVLKDTGGFVAEAQRLFLPSGWSLPEPISGGAEQQQQASWLAAGLAVLADWLGSNTRWFRYHRPTLSLADYWHQVALPRATLAINESGLLAAEPARDTGFARLFPPIADTPTHLQTWADTVLIAPGPQLIVLEEVTGGGKTEAALTLAARLMAQHCGTGVYFALPTMATADAMFDRVQKSADGDNQAPWQRFFTNGEPCLVLAHSAAQTRQKLDALQTRDAGYDDRREEASASQHSSAWLADSRKKALLADFGVGTVDQALLAVMRLRHQSLRLLGLSTKVLVVDEVHACDCYMGELLARLLHFHAALGGSAILLSATLPLEQRNRLLAAFANGAGYATGKPEKTDYPLASHLHASGLHEQPIQAREEASRTVSVEPLADEEAVFQRLRATLKHDGCAVWVRNTVADAVSAWSTWRNTFPDLPATLFHARFALCDRLKIGERINNDFGPESAPESRRGKLVIATQVIEQSLDVDFDDMVSDLAPIDLIVQRAGRLQRHKRAVEGIRATLEGRGGAKLGILMPEPLDTAAADWFKQLLPKAARVYTDHGRLWLTARWLTDHGHFALPRDARLMIETVYGETGFSRTPVGLQKSSDAKQGACYSERSLARQNSLSFDMGYDTTGTIWPDEDTYTDIPTRLGDPTVRLRLARRYDDGLHSWASTGSSIDWSLSELTVAMRLAAKESSRYSELIERARKDMADEGRYSLIVPLEQCEHDWRGWAENAKGEEVRVIYSHISGLRIENGEAIDESDL